MNPDLMTNNDVSTRLEKNKTLPSGSTELDVIEIADGDTSDHGTSLSPSASEVEDETLLNQPTISMVSTVKKPLEAPSSPQTKVLFLDGVRGLAAMLVYLQHSHDFGPGLSPGGIGVDIFFVLSSFLLTWLFMKKSMKLLAQGANLRTWSYVLVDYFQKRFLRVYPLFFVTVVILALMTPEEQERYFTFNRPPLDILRTLIFEFDYRYHVFWSLPLEIAYYFVIPVFVMAVLGMRRFWWVSALPLAVWVVYEGFYTIRSNHMPMRPHISTFLTGSLAAVVFVKLDLWMKKKEFEFRWWHTIIVRAVEWLTIGTLLSVSFCGLLFTWVHSNPAPPIGGEPYISSLVSTIIVVEMIHPSWVSTMFEWNVLCYCGKISFSVYLMHPFVVENTREDNQPYYYDRLFSRLFLIPILATATYYLVEYPSLLLAQRISRHLTAQEKKAMVGAI
uniref:Acyltransferase 3 domain-containing protein n=1 Tax=Hyaloperonospora arabidopsidis (strain Emoy2) TaxID=559515 RepID=M4BVE5_HYAAE